MVVPQKAKLDKPGDTPGLPKGLREHMPVTCPLICVALLTVGSDATSLGGQQQKKCSLSTQWITFNHDDVCDRKVEVKLPRGTKGTGEGVLERKAMKGQWQHIADASIKRFLCNSAAFTRNRNIETLAVL